jgi:hypothetical protein
MTLTVAQKIRPPQKKIATRGESFVGRPSSWKSAAPSAASA